MNRSRRGEAVVVTIVVIAAIGFIGWLVKPKLFPGESRRAAQSTEATAKLIAADAAQESAAAASVVKIGEANSVAPDSPSKNFISSEVPLALSRMRSPDPQELINAERRRVAVMEGKLDEARRLYEQAAKKSASLQSELNAAVAARHSADLALEQAAAAHHARTTQALGLAVLVVALGAAYIYLKFNHISFKSAGDILHDISSGVDPRVAFDTHTAPRVQSAIAKARKLAAH